MKRIPVALALGLSLPFASLPLQAQTTVTAPGAAAGVAAEVNGEKIMSADLNRMLASIKSSDPGFANNTPATAKALAQIKAQLLDELITTRLLAQEAKRRGIAIDAKAVDAAVEGVKTGNGFKTDADFKVALQKDGKTPDDLRRAISDELAIRQLSTQLAADVTVSNDDIAKFYRDNLDKFTVPEGVKARHILLAINPSAPPAEKERVRKRALDLIAQLNKKADFVALAKTNSDDQSNKDRGGDLGAFARGQMVKSFEDAAFAAPVGKIVGPIETEFGIHILRVDEKIAARTLSLTEIQKDPQMRAYLLKQKVQKRLDDSIVKLKSAAKIKKNV